MSSPSPSPSPLRGHELEFLTAVQNSEHGFAGIVDVAALSAGIAVGAGVALIFSLAIVRFVYPPPLRDTRSYLLAFGLHVLTLPLAGWLSWIWVGPRGSLRSGATDPSMALVFATPLVLVPTVTCLAVITLRWLLHPRRL